MSEQRQSPWVVRFQYLILVGFTCFALSVILWVSHLIRISLYWQDHSSVSVAISVIAIPVFLTLLSLVHYVFWGLRKHANDPVGGGHGPAVVLMGVLAVAASSDGLADAARGSNSELPDNPVEGWSLLVDKGCLECHALRGVGETRAPDLGYLERAHSRLDTAGLFWNHAIEMEAALGRMGLQRQPLTSDEMGQLLAFLYLQAYFDQDASADAGRRIYETARCPTCHGGEGEGGTAPSLAMLGASASMAGVGTAIWNHGPQMSQALQRQGIAYPIFTGRDLLDVTEYIQTSAQPSDRAPDLVEPGNPNRGLQLLNDKGCLACHSLGGGGATRAPDLAASNQVDRTQSALVARLWNHGPTMWPVIRSSTGSVPKLTVDEMNDLSMALYFQGYLDRPGDLAKGQEHYVDKGCSNCHGVPGGGAPSGGAPQLAGSTVLATDEAVVAAIWNHLPAMVAATEAGNRRWPTFVEGEMADLVTYLRSLDAPAPPQP